MRQTTSWVFWFGPSHIKRRWRCWPLTGGCGSHKIITGYRGEKIQLERPDKYRAGIIQSSKYTNINQNLVSSSPHKTWATVDHLHQLTFCAHLQRTHTAAPDCMARWGEPWHFNVAASILLSTISRTHTSKVKKTWWRVNDTNLLARWLFPQLHFCFMRYFNF